jgi:hypothetical protein
MAKIHWKNGVSGSFDTASDWSTGSVPGSTDDVFIDAGGTYTVTSSLTEAVASLASAVGTTLEVTAGEFDVGKGNAGANYINSLNGTSTGACTISGTIIANAYTGLGIADPISNMGTIEAIGNGRFSNNAWGEIVLEPYGNSTNTGTIDAGGGLIYMYLADTYWTNPLGFAPTTFVNYGIMKSTANGILDLNGLNTSFGGVDIAFTNLGQLEAIGGLIEIDAPIIGGGTAIISNGGELDIRHAGFANNIVFNSASTGTLGIMFGGYADFGVSGSFTGTLSGFANGDAIDLMGLNFGATTTVTYSSNQTGGVLQVSDGTNSTAIALAGTYSAAGFQVANDGLGFALVTYSGSIVGGSGNDTFHAFGTNLTFSGGGGHDTIIFDGTSNQYTVTNNGDGSVTVSDSSPNRDGTHKLIGVEDLQFTDKIVFVENSDNANIARLYSAALDRAPDPAGLDGWEDAYANLIPASAKAQGVFVALAETGLNGGSLSVAGGFTQSVEFQQKYGALSDAGFVTQLYQNVLGRGPDAAGLAGWLDAMAHGTTREIVLVGFAESPENIAKTAGDWLISV